MAADKPMMKMPELVIFAKMVLVGFVALQIFRLSFYLGESFAKGIADITLWIRVVGVAAGLILCVTYALHRGAYTSAARMWRSGRIDLLVPVIVGGWVSELVAPRLSKLHTAFKAAEPGWAPALLTLLAIVLLSALVRHYFPRPKKQASQLYFLADDEIFRDDQDVLANKEHANSFAQTVLASSMHPGLVFGVDGPWGAGKTSFINLAQRHWMAAQDQVIVCRFEPLRYASEPDLADRLIRDLSAAIQTQVFAPEFKPAASRYSRLIKGKADISFLGLKLSLEPSQETVDELLDDIDQVLRRIRRRVIVVIDDLDRLDAKTTNNVLFATKRTFKLSQATYVLCYDTEVLATASEHASLAREFLEKFVTVKLSLFVDSSSLRDFLRSDWDHPENQIGSVPSDTMVKLGEILTELAEILDGDLAPQYMPMVGNLRKVKRFINAMLLMQIEKTELGRTDFNKRDLINLILLHLNYPGVFRQIYAEETQGRQGRFSLRRDSRQTDFHNAQGFAEFKDAQPEAARFLLEQLFDMVTLEVEDSVSEESVRRSRACFNTDSSRNLEAYLQLIVRFVRPVPQDTFILYQSAVDRVLQGEPIRTALCEPDLALAQGDTPHDQFWRLLVNQSYNFTAALSDQAIETLVEYLPRYSSLDQQDRALRQRSIYSLLRLLDRAGWGRTTGNTHRHRLENSSENVQEIAWRLFGEERYQGRPLIEQLTSPDRGVLGWNDLMLLRLQCSADRQGQLHNLHRALIVNQDRDAATTGLVTPLALMGMRKLSQRVFALFKRVYIVPGRNYLADVASTPDAAFLGEALSQQHTPAPSNGPTSASAPDMTSDIEAVRNLVKTFVIYQLSNTKVPNGSGGGCGHYDEEGARDEHGIARAMNDYVFDVCFALDAHDDNMQLFLDYCLSNLSSPFRTGRDDNRYIATAQDLTGGLDSAAMGRYWQRHRERYLAANWQASTRNVHTGSYTASYSSLPMVFTVLDELANEASSAT